MKVLKITDAHKAFVLKQGEEEMPVAKVGRNAGLSPAYFNWKKYEGLNDAANWSCSPPGQRMLQTDETGRRAGAL